MNPEIYDQYIDTAIERRNFDEVFNQIQKIRVNNPDHPVTSLLDLCCGTAIFRRNYFHHNLTVPYTGVDINENFIEYARKQIRSERSNPNFNPNLVVADAVTIDFKIEFDIVIATSAYHHIVDEKKVSFLQNMARHMKKEGRGIIYEKLIGKPKIIGKSIDPAEIAESGIEFYKQRILYMMQTETLNENQVFSLYNEMYLTAIRQDEYKVSKERLESDIRDASLEIEDVIKLWPTDNIFNNPDIGDFVFVVRK